MIRKIRIAICVLLTIVLSCGQLFALSHLLQRKSSEYKHHPFFTEKENLDVLFMGTSHVLCGVSPMELWDEYGIVSYNLAGNGNEMATSYWVLENALEYTKPKLVVIDCLKLGSDKKIADSKEYVHYSFDAFPTTKTKINAINDLFEEKDREEMLVDFSTYHSRWNDLTKEDVVQEYTTEKGAETKIGVAVPKNPIWLKDKEKTADHTVGATYLRKMIETCQKRGIKVLLTYLPFPPAMYHQKDANLAEDIAKEYGVSYINFLNMKEIIDYHTDCFDPDSHLNVSGASKVTSYLGKYIKNHYGIADHRKDSKYSNWNEDYTNYTKFKFDNLEAQTALDNSLMLLSDKNMSTCLYIKGSSKLLQDQRMVGLIKNMTTGKKLTKLQQAISQKSDYLVIIDKSKGKISEVVGNGTLNLETSLGKISYTGNDKKGGKLSINGKAVEENNISSDVMIMTADKKTNEIKYEAAFNANGTDKKNNIMGLKVETKETKETK